MRLKKNILSALFLLLFSVTAFAANAQLKMTPIPQTAPVKISPAYVAAVKKKAQSGNAAAEFNLAVLYHNGTGVKQDYQKSLFWMKKAANDGDTDAPLNLYAVYSNGTGVKKDMKQAADWCERAAKAGNVRAAFVLAGLYKKGTGVPKNIRLAKAWLLHGLRERGKLQQAAAKPHPKPAFNTTAAVLSGMTGFVIFGGIMFFYISRQKKKGPPNA